MVIAFIINGHYRLMMQCVQPFAKFLYPSLGQLLDSHHGFVVEYEVGKDVNLGFHVDDSEVCITVVSLVNNQLLYANVQVVVN